MASVRRKWPPLCRGGVSIVFCRDPRRGDRAAPRPRRGVRNRGLERAGHGFVGGNGGAGVCPAPQRPRSDRRVARDRPLFRCGDAASRYRHGPARPRPARIRRFREDPSARGARWRGLVSHLACADDPGHPLNGRQRARFVAACDRFAGTPKSLAASSGHLPWSGFSFRFCAAGCGALRRQSAAWREQPDASGRAARARECCKSARSKRAEPVGYGATIDGGARAARHGSGRLCRRLAAFPEPSRLRLSRRRAGAAGRPGLDGPAVFDVSAVEPARRSAAAGRAFGRTITGSMRPAADAGTIGYEILTALGPRYHRVYRGGRFRLP